MRSADSPAWMIWKAAKYLALIVVSSIVGAQLGTVVGAGIGALTGEPSWAAHGRCAGWTLFVLIAAVGAPFGFVYFCEDKVPKSRKFRRTPPPQENEAEPEVREDGRTVSGMKAVPRVFLFGGIIGMVFGAMLVGCLVALYFFAALSPLGPGGWWPVLPLAFQSTGDGFSATNVPFGVLCLIVFGTVFVLGIVLAMIGGPVTSGGTRYQVFRSKADRNQEKDELHADISLRSDRQSQVTRIRSRKDLIAFFQQQTGDHKLALLLTDAVETNGRDGYIDVRQGGSGNPYAVEYEHRSDEERAADHRTSGEIRAELDRLKEALNSATADDERDRLERQIAWLAGGVCTLWINVTPSADYERQRRLITESFRKFKSVC